MNQEPYIPVEDAEKIFKKDSPTLFQLKRLQMQRDYWFSEHKEEAPQGEEYQWLWTI